MFKFRNKQKKAEYSIRSSIMIGSIFVIIGIAYGFGFSPFKNIETKISQMQAKALEQLENQYLNDNKIETNLFKNNLRTQNNTKEISISLALSATQKTINEQNNCDLSTNEIVGFIYLNDKEFKNHIDYLNRQDKEKLENPDWQSLMAQGCLKLSKCINPNALNASEQLAKCSQKITEIYTTEKQAAAEQQKIQTSNLGNNKYQNGDTKDAQYDLIEDISKIGKILFDGFKTAPQILFYAAPNFNKLGNNKSNEQNGSPTIDNSQNNISPNTIPQNQDNTQLPTSQYNKENTPTTEDEEINQFLVNNEQNIVKNSDEETLFVNQCLPLNTTKSVKDENNTGGIISLNATFKNQGIKNKIGDNTLQNSLQSIENITNPKIPTHTTNNTINTNTNFPGKTEEEVDNCITKCNTRDKNGKYLLAIDERQVCKLQCLCGEYISPALPKGADFPILNESALRLRFCTIPAKAIQVNTSSKSIYSISEIIQELKNPITKLNLGGRLTTKEQKTEFLDSDLSYRNLSKNAAIITTIAQKAPETKTSEQDKKTENEAILKVLESNTNFGRNSFIVTGLPQSTVAKNIKSEQTANAPDLTTETIATKTVIYRNNLANSNLHLAEFLSKNETFLTEFYTKLQEINDSLTALKNKKNKGD